jgi:hypothetical protein
LRPALSSLSSTLLASLRQIRQSPLYDRRMVGEFL